MGLYKRIKHAPTMVGKFNHYIYLSSYNGRDDYFFLTVNHDSTQYDVIARIIQHQNRWYIWYEKKKVRLSVKSFTEATQILEKEVMNCVA